MGFGGMNFGRVYSRYRELEQRTSDGSSGGDWGFETSDDLWYVVLVEFLDSIFQVLALLPFNQKLRYLFTTLDVLGFHLSHLPFLRASPLCLGLNGPERVLWELALVLLKSLFRFLVPYLTLLIRQTLPSDADDLGQSGMIRLDLGGNVLTLDERGAEEDEGVGRARDMVLWFLSGVGLAFGSGDFLCRREEDRFGGGINEWGRSIGREIDSSYISHKGRADEGMDSWSTRGAHKSS
jgi:hypothetical protein